MTNTRPDGYKPKRKYTRRKAKSTGDSMPTTPVEESPFEKELRDSLVQRQDEIDKEVAAIINQTATMAEQRAALEEELVKVRAGLKALGR